MSYSCRICGETSHEVVLEFGEVALADSFLASQDAIAGEKKYPLTLVICSACAHLQIKEILDPSLLFSNYVWETGIPASIGEYCRRFVDFATERAALQSSASVLEIASNDGTLLREFQSRGFRVLGVDPARNIAQKAIDRGIETLPEFFGIDVATRIHRERGRFQLITARNVLAHVADLHGVIAGIRLLLAKGGTAIIEVPHLLTMFDELQYDQVFHEHIGYHSLDSIIRAFARHDLNVVDVEEVWIHGGSIRVLVSHAREGAAVRSSVATLVGKEREAGLLEAASWRGFSAKVHEQRRAVREEIARVRNAGGRVAGYGASGKGQSMIQFCGLDRELIDYLVDKSSMKIGKLAPGSHIPIVSPEQLRKGPPAVLVLFAWNFAKEILVQESALRDQGMRFLHPIPAPRYL